MKALQSPTARGGLGVRASPAPRGGYCFLITFADLCSGGSMENVMNAVHPSSRFLASNS